MGYEVIQAANGKECLEILPVTNPDLIIMDMQMRFWTGMKQPVASDGNYHGRIFHYSLNSPCYDQ